MLLVGIRQEASAICKISHVLAGGSTFNPTNLPIIWKSVSE